MPSLTQQKQKIEQTTTQKNDHIITSLDVLVSQRHTIRLFKNIFFYLCLSNEILGTWTWKLSLLTWTHIVSGEINQKLSIGIETYACFLYRFQYISTLGTERKSFHKLRSQSALYKYNAKLYWWPLQWFIVDKFLMTRLKLNSAQKAATCSKKAPVQC